MYSRISLTSFLPVKNPIARSFFQTTDHLLGLTKLHKIYETAKYASDPTTFLNILLEVFNVSYTIDGEAIQRIPAKGPLIVVANHPFGGIEGIILTHLLQFVRPDSKVLANHLLGSIPELRRYFILVNPFGTTKAKLENLKGMKQALEHLNNGGALGMFPAGEVSHLQLDKGNIEDPSWNPHFIRLVQKSDATILPIYFKGRNSILFNLAGLLHPRFRTAFLPGELLNKRGQTIELAIGNPIPASKLHTFETADKAAQYIRKRTYILQNKPQRKCTFKDDGAKSAFAASIKPASLLNAEIHALPQDQLLIEHQDYQVWMAQSEQIPHLLKEIGYLREQTFRQVGEGTGKELDLDTFDKHYTQLVLWNTTKQEVAGGYRFCQTDKVFRTHGLSGLYTNQLFRFTNTFLEKVGPALELGRSFVRPEYQRSYAPLMLLWKAIGQYITQNPIYTKLLGPVTISNDYHYTSRRLIVDFLKAHLEDPALTPHIKARTPFRGRPLLSSPGDFSWFPTSDIEEVSQLISDLEGMKKSVPVLLKQYLKLGGKILGFNIDVNFNDALDGLLLVDLLKTDKDKLLLYMGEQGVETFYSYHQKDHQAKAYKAASPG